MKLHNDKENFKAAIKATSRFFNVSEAIIEKDYFVTLVLLELTNQIPGLIFKGGTSLSKCYKIIPIWLSCLKCFKDVLLLNSPSEMCGFTTHTHVHLHISKLSCLNDAWKLRKVILHHMKKSNW